MIICLSCKKEIFATDKEILCTKCNKKYSIIDGIACFASDIMHTYDEGFDVKFFEFLYSLENRHFWFKARNILIKKSIQQITSARSNKKQRLSFLEIGCGNGYVLTSLKRNSSLNISGGDVFFEALSFCKKRGNDSLYQIDAMNLPFVNHFEIIGLFDSLEHIEDDVKVLENIHAALKEEGQIVLTVPANKSMWSNVDIISKHKRRYSREELVDKLSKTGFRIERISYFFTFLFPLLWLIRKLTDNNYRKNKSLEDYLETKSIPLLNTIFYLIMRFEVKILERVNLPFGSSLIAIAKKEPKV